MNSLRLRRISLLRKTLFPDIERIDWEFYKMIFIGPEKPRIL